MECKGREDKTGQFIRARDRLLKKIYEWNMQELGDTPQSDKNHKSWTQKEEKTFKPKMKHFSEENNHGKKKSSNLGKEKPTQIQEGHRTPNRQDWRRGFLCQITL